MGGIDEGDDVERSLVFSIPYVATNASVWVTAWQGRMIWSGFKPILEKLGQGSP